MSGIYHRDDIPADLRSYFVRAEIGLEDTPDAFVARLVDVFREVRRVLRDDGTLWLNLGDSYGASGGDIFTGFNERWGGTCKGGGKQAAIAESAKAAGAVKRDTGLRPKNLLGIPWRVAFALQADGWYLRQDIIWHKPNPMPESVTDRCTKAHEYVFLLSKSPRYYFDNEAIKEPVAESSAGRLSQPTLADQAGSARVPGKTNGNMKAVGGADGKRNRRSVWTVTTKPFKGAHFATFPPDLIEPCVLAGCPPARKSCDCDEIIRTPTGTVEAADPSLEVGRAGMSRPRGENEGVRPITRRQQRHNAAEMKASPHKAAMRAEVGQAFDHYVRTDRSGARPLPASTFSDWLGREWITLASPCNCPIEPAGVVLDPFFGAGTTGLVAQKHGRRCVGIELNPEYVEIAKKRLGLPVHEGVFG